MLHKISGHISASTLHFYPSNNDIHTRSTQTRRWNCSYSVYSGNDCDAARPCHVRSSHLVSIPTHATKMRLFYVVACKYLFALSVDSDWIGNINIKMMMHIICEGSFTQQYKVTLKKCSLTAATTQQ